MPPSDGSRTAPIAYGIDFGTSNSAVSIAYADRVDLVPVSIASRAPTLPSVIYLHRKGRREAGEEATREFLLTGHAKTDCWRCSLAPYGWDTDCRQYRKGGGCSDSRLLSGVKHDLAKAGFAGTNSWATDFSVADLVAVVLGRLKRSADSACSADVRRVVVGHPVRFAGVGAGGDDPGQETARLRLRQSAEQAGFEQVELLPEPTAAMLGDESTGRPGLFLAADFGGGTFDVAVLDARGDSPRVTALQGVAVGGDRLDGVLFEVKVGPALGLEGLPNWLFNDMRTPAGAALLMADPGIPNVLARLPREPASVAGAILLEGQAYGFYRAVEAAKIALSRDEEVRLQYRKHPIDLDLPLQRSGFESMIQPELDEVMGAVDAALEQAGVGPDQVDRVLLTGGSSQIPAFRRRLAERFDEGKLESQDAFTAVVRGLGTHARNLWGQGFR
jgi:hypothetical chaperone protein